MIKYFIMKRNERKVKAMFYGMIASFLDNQKEVIDLLQKLFVALKDIPVDELKAEFVKQLAEIIHEENKSKTE